MNNSILKDINQIEELTIEAEISVIKALCDCYEKQALILEYSTSENVSEFSVFQEGFKDVLNEAKGDKGENIVLRILKFIPRLVMGLAKMIRSKWGGKSRIKQLEDDIAALKEINERYRGRLDSLENELLSKADKKYVRDKVEKAEDRLNGRINNNLQRILDVKAAQSGLANNLEKKIDYLDDREEIRDRVNKKAQFNNANRIGDLEDKLQDANERLKNQADDHMRETESLRKRINELEKQIDIASETVKPHCKLKEYTEAVEERARFIVSLSKFDFKNDDVKMLGKVDSDGLFNMKTPEKSIAGLGYWDPKYIMSYDEFVDCVKRLNAAFETITKTVKPIIVAVNEAIANLPEFETRKERLKATQPYRDILFCISTAEEIIKNNIESVNKMMNEINELRKIYGKVVK